MLLLNELISNANRQTLLGPQQKQAFQISQCQANRFTVDHFDEIFRGRVVRMMPICALLQEYICIHSVYRARKDFMHERNA